MADESSAPPFEIALSGRDDSATIIEKTERVVFRICSPTGIGRATITRCGPSWPANAVVRLHVSGLESFQVSKEATDNVLSKPTRNALTLHAAVSSHPVTPSIRQWRNSDENRLLDKESPYWMPIKRFDSGGQRATKMPLRRGYIELGLPAILFAENPRMITLRWVDFYRG